MDATDDLKQPEIQAMLDDIPFQVRQDATHNPKKCQYNTITGAEHVGCSNRGLRP